MYKIGLVFVSVSQRSHGRTVLTTELKFGRNIAFDNISDKVKGQGCHLEKHDFPTFSYGVTYVDCTELFCHDN